MPLLGFPATLLKTLERLHNLCCSCDTLITDESPEIIGWPLERSCDALVVLFRSSNL